MWKKCNELTPIHVLEDRVRGQNQVAMERRMVKDLQKGVYSINWSIKLQENGVQKPKEKEWTKELRCIFILRQAFTELLHCSGCSCTWDPPSCLSLPEYQDHGVLYHAHLKTRFKWYCIWNSKRFIEELLWGRSKVSGKLLTWSPCWSY